MRIDKITRNSKPVDYERNLHLVTIKPQSPLQPGSVDSLQFLYRGSIDEDACYADINESFRGRINKNFLTTIDKRYGFVTPDYVLLTRENLWYPVPGAWGVFTEKQGSDKDFIRYTFTVTTRDDLIPISQGAEKKPASGAWRFTPEYPLTQISLVIGKYKRLSMTHEGVDYSLYHLEGNDFFMQYLAGLKEKQVREQIQELRNYFESGMNISYPFRRFSIIEVPVQFLAHYRPQFLQMEYLQPEQVFLPERGVLIPVHVADMKRTKRYFTVFAQYHPLRFTGIKAYILGKTLLDTFSETYPNISIFIAKEIARGKRLFSSAKLYAYINPSFLYDFNLYPMFYAFSCDFSSKRCPLFDQIMSYYLRSKMKKGFEKIGSDGIYVNQRIIAQDMMAEKSLSDWIYSGEKSFAIPEMMMLKAEELFKTIGYVAGEDTFKTFIDEYIKSHRYESNSGVDFIKRLDSEFDVDFQKYYDRIMDMGDYPSFVISNIKRKKISVRDYRNWQTTDFYRYNLTIYNKGSDGGLIRIGVTVKDGSFHKYTYLDAHQAKRIGFDISMPFQDLVYFQTFNALNKSSFIMYVADDVLSNPEDFIDGEVIIEPPQPESGIIVDDNDPGFSIIENGKRSALVRLFDLDRISDYEFTYYDTRHPPARWTKVLDEFENRPTDFFGRLNTTVHYVESGKGTKKVQWKAEIPESGTYDVLFYKPDNKKFTIYSMSGASCALKDFHFIICHNNEADEVVIDVSKSSNSWLFLGTYDFSEGPASIVLTDESQGRFVYADAVRWLKRETSQ